MKEGNFVIITDHPERENEADLMLPAEYVTKEKIGFMRKHCSGIICVPLTQERAKELQLPRMVERNTDRFNTPFTISVDAKALEGGGVSDDDRCRTIKVLAGGTSSELSRPGHVFPLIAHPDGLAGRQGHTEATIDLLQRASLFPAGVICELMNDDGMMMRGEKLHQFAQVFGIPLIAISQLANSDEYYMRRALYLAGQGTPSPNPYVGCVIVKDGRIIGEGFHQKAGEHHAEINALASCTESPEGATIYTTLEPCSHYGKTPPCVDALIKAKVQKVIFAMKDPNPLVDSVSMLQKAGIEVIEGVLRNEAEAQNNIFRKYITTGMPYIYLKAALTLDGKIATHTHHSRWISSEESRTKVHQLRSKVDAILIGKNTVLKDNPHLTARNGTISYPTRVVLDYDDTLPETLNVFTQPGKTIILTAVQSAKKNRILCPAEEGRINLCEALKLLAKEGISSILVEGGSSVFSQFITHNLVDEFLLFMAPKILGDDTAIPLMNGRHLLNIDESIRLRFTGIEPSGTDIMVRAVYD